VATKVKVPKAPNPFGLGRTSLKLLQSVEQREAETVVPANYHLIQSVAELEQLAAACQASRLIVLDTETHATHPTLDKPSTKWWLPDFRVTAFGIYTGGGAYMVPLEMIHAPVNMTRASVQDVLGPVLEDVQISKVFHNAKFDMHAMWRTFDIEMRHTLQPHDVGIASWILDETLRKHDLEVLCTTYLGTERWKIQQDGNFHLWPIKMAQVYLGGDVENTMKLYEFQREFLHDNPAYAKLASLYADVEMPHLVEVLLEMERTGIAWDQEYFEAVARPEVDAKCALAQRIAHEHMGPINLNSPQQVAAVLFDGFKLEPGEGRGRSVDKRVLAGLKGQHPAVDALETYRQNATIKSNYTDTLPDYVVGGRIHPNIKGIGATTGRLSCADPNLQKLPKRVGPLIRKAFVPSPGYTLGTWDYSQIELRILAHLSGDENMIRMFEAGGDFHTLTAHNMFGVPLAELEADKDRPERITAKNINFGIPYGIGAQKLADSVNLQLHSIGIFDRDMTKAQAQAAIDAWERSYPQAALWIRAMKLQAHKQGFVETLLGRKRRLFDEMASREHWLVASGERMAVNAPIQGSSGDMIKVAAVRMWRHIQAQHWPYRILLSIHDELIFEAPTAWLMQHRDTMDELTVIMQDAIPLRVPIKVSVELLDRWGQKHVEDDVDFEEDAA
jgi:DNA polymerase I